LKRMVIEMLFTPEIWVTSIRSHISSHLTRILLPISMIGCGRITIQTQVQS